MEYLIKDQWIELKYVPGKGAWTYHLQIPGTRHLVGRWGSLKVSGTVDRVAIQAKNLFTIGGQDKLLSINAAIRKALGKNGGELVKVTLYLVAPYEKLTANDVLDTFRNEEVFTVFSVLSQQEQSMIMENILSQKTEVLQFKKLEYYLKQLAKR
ncbi:MAG: DUF1905 domain-containing protein [Chitinophagaceae bacterium]|nr:DUF1905 domain-containing protein [Chitinophagaceae bacterium]